MNKTKLGMHLQIGLKLFNLLEPPKLILGM